MRRNWLRRIRPGTSGAAHRPVSCRPKLEWLEKREVPTLFPPGFTEVNIATGLTSPTAMDFSPDGRLFVCQQGGALRVIKNGSLLPTPFVTVPTSANGERGLLGVAFHPDFANNGFVYVFYTVTTAPIHNRVSRFTANPANPDVALAGSEVVTLELDNLSGATNHNGGAIHFGADGKLYVAAGENATPPFAQSPRNTHGKLLRINPDGTIPPDNPFATSSRARKEIWAMGFRNPFTFAVQPGTGRIYVNDVGSSGGGRREEVNELFKKGNYAWPTFEGYTTNPAYVSPVFAYSSTFNGSNCAVTGGTFFNPSVNPYPAEYLGKYFFQDLCGNWMAHLDPDAAVPQNTVTSFATAISSTLPVDIKVGPDGHLYYAVIGGGGIVRKINYTAPIPPPDSDHGNAPLVTAALNGDEAPFNYTQATALPITVDPISVDAVHAAAANTEATEADSMPTAPVTPARPARADRPFDNLIFDPLA